MNKIITLLAVSLLFFGCGNEPTSPTTEPNTTAQFTIEGMVCAQGCAKRIEDKIARMEGVSSSSVNYDTKQATISFDNSIVKSNQFVSLIEELNDQQYQVENLTENQLKTETINGESKNSKEDKLGKILTQPNKFELPNLLKFITNIL